KNAQVNKKQIVRIQLSEFLTVNLRALQKLLQTHEAAGTPIADSIIQLVVNKIFGSENNPKLEERLIVVIQKCLETACVVEIDGISNTTVLRYVLTDLKPNSDRTLNEEQISQIQTYDPSTMPVCTLDVTSEKSLDNLALISQSPFAFNKANDLKKQFALRYSPSEKKDDDGSVTNYRELLLRARTTGLQSDHRREDSAPTRQNGETSPTGKPPAKKM
ncbi:MAG TPA: hypothetical protein VJ205_05120, partial [Gammaproteobacteria bacterium]|nr:hypothetical protein [Gammaproteobacteria bacterium]